jgi:hypothetical protein
MNDYIKKRVRESIDFTVLESLMAEDYPVTFNMDEFKSLKTFQKRIQYCQQNLKRISSGSSRIVYKIDDTKVLKLAKNSKGIQQNETEIDWGRQSYYDDILAQTLDFDSNSLWVEMELATKVNEAIFKEYMGIDMLSFEEYITLRHNERNGKRSLYQVPQSVKDYLDEDNFANQLLAFINDSDALIGDLFRYSSYGLVTRSDGKRVVLIDFGITQDIYDGYYS